MGSTIGGSGHGLLAEMNVVPFIDILLALLVIFMIIQPPHSTGLDAAIPQVSAPDSAPPPAVIVVQVSLDGSLRINREPVTWSHLPGRLDQIFRLRAQRVAFVRGDDAVEFGVMARVIDTMRGVGISSIGLLTPATQQGR